jgi:tetratricopeptide (TPR) repeat protein
VIIGSCYYLYENYILYNLAITKQQKRIEKYQNNLNNVSKTLGSNDTVPVYSPVVKEPIVVYNQPVDPPEQDQTNQDQAIDTHRQLFLMYRDGVPDTYDELGNFIPGIRPNIEQMFFHLDRIINSSQVQLGDYLNAARIYHYGMYDVEPDINEAVFYYQQAINVCDDNVLARNLYENIRELNYNRAEHSLRRMGVNIRDVRGANIDAGPVFIPIQDEELPQLNYLVVPDKKTTVRDANGNIKYIDDSQNTHDSGIVNGVLESIQKLKNKHARDSTKDKEIIEEIRDYADKNLKNDKKNAVMNILSGLTYGKHSNYDVSEIEALGLVWNEIKDLTSNNELNPDDVRNNLMDEISQMKEHGKTVCQTGRIDHIINSLNGIAGTVTIRPSYATKEITQELINRSGVIYGEVDGDISELKKKLREEYNGILSDEDFTRYTKDWIDKI